MMTAKTFMGRAASRTDLLQHRKYTTQFARLCQHKSLLTDISGMCNLIALD